MRYKAVVSYDGTSFAGWQVQPDKKTVQGEIEKTLAQITGLKIRITGSGRTDAGVHALGQVASFTIESPTLTSEKLAHSLNSMLPETIYIKSLTEVSPDFDARRSARSKLYRYRILTTRSPLRRLYAWDCGYKLNISAMKQGAALLEGTHDYSALCEVDDERTSIPVDMINVYMQADELHIEVRAKGFLYKMVRRIAGIITECGRGKIEPDIIPTLFTREKPVQTVTVPARGLTLIEVYY